VSAFSEEVVPILSAGHYNISSRKALNKLKAKHGVVLVGFSSPACHRCITAENEYVKLSGRLLERFKVRHTPSTPVLKSATIDPASDDCP
jgi:hypothetical protein